jgi:hypothetical protein
MADPTSLVTDDLLQLLIWEGVSLVVGSPHHPDPVVKKARVGRDLLLTSSVLEEVFTQTTLFPSCSYSLAVELAMHVATLRSTIKSWASWTSPFVLFSTMQPRSYYLEYIKMNPCQGLKLKSFSD